MHLSELVGAIEAQSPDPEISGITADSRELRPGWLFAALPGTRQDGAAFIDEAVRRGAAAVLAGPGVAVPDGVPLARRGNPRQALALAAARFYGAQPEIVVAVTGTNGKTSVASFARQIWSRLGTPAASLGTLGVVAPGFAEPLLHTTPDPVALHGSLARLRQAGVGALALEASSHGLDQYRLDGVRLTAAGFTNISRDHYDYHATPEAYLTAKRRLFAELLPAGGTAVLNADAVGFEAMAEAAAGRGHRLLTYGRAGRELRLLGQVPTARGQRLDCEILGKRHTVELPLVGSFQAWNALCALGLVLASGSATEAAIAALARLEGVPGRLQCVGRHASGAPVFVDYAHTPDALETVLKAVRPHAAGRLAVVFGCGGDRDRGKRPLMGRIAAALADRVVVTDDNPRSEDPAAIRRAILDACPGALEIGDRAAAIHAAVAALGSGDILVVAGKGHEQGQRIGDLLRPFDDAAVAAAALARAAGAG